MFFKYKGQLIDFDVKLVRKAMQKEKEKLTRSHTHHSRTDGGTRSAITLATPYEGPPGAAGTSDCGYL